MPLQFHSISHKAVPFGFFNIKTDMLMLLKRFFFAPDFCAMVRELAKAGPPAETTLDCWRIDHPAMIGDIQAAITGVSRKGFIGATYGIWPFPKKKTDFKQDPEGHLTRDGVEELISHISKVEHLRMRWTGRVVSFDSMSFSLEEFGKLVAYVDHGGHPGWKDDRRPDCVTEMMAELKEIDSPLLG